MSKWQWVVAQLTGRLWFWAVVYSVGAVLTALIAIALTPFIPDQISAEVGASAVEDILSILASSMLAVTTFSLATMVSAFTASTTTTTPRAAQLLLEDRTSQNAIASFVGTFLFSLVGIIALRAGLYGASGRLILFGVTLLVVLTVVVTLLKWIDHLSRLGRLDEILDRLEKAATTSLRSEFRRPPGDVEPLDEESPDVHRVESSTTGYVKYVDVEKLSQLAEDAEGHVSVLRRSGAFVAAGDPLALASWQVPDEQVQALQECFVVGASRSLEQDPRYSLILLSEVASRALSPGVNDPGTAIDVLARIVRVLATIEANSDEENLAELPPHVDLVDVTVADIFDDVFTPIARDGAGVVEVGVRLQRAFATLAQHEIYRTEARRQSALALKRADLALTLDEDKAAVQSARELVATRDRA